MTKPHLTAASALLVIASPLAAQETGADALVTDRLEAPAVADLPPPSERVGETVEVNGATIFYQAAGDGPPMLLLHGYPLSGALFARVREALEEDWTVITVDHRGYGLSEAPAVPDSIETYASDGLAVLDHLGIDRAVIGGMSMGGPITFAMYQQDPDRFTGMILIDTTAAAATPPEAGLWRGVEEVIAAKGLAPIITAFMPDLLTGETRMTEPAVVEYMAAIMEGASVEAGRGGAIALAERPDFTGMLGDIDVPTLVIVGQADALYPIEIARKLADAIPNATLAILPEASHAAVFETPGTAAAAIANWAEGI